MVPQIQPRRAVPDMVYLQRRHVGVASFPRVVRLLKLHLILGLRVQGSPQSNPRNRFGINLCRRVLRTNARAP